MYLYHYTSLWHLKKIMDDGVLKTTCSNLLEPIHPHIENGRVVDETDSYKPVVWFSSVLDFEKASGCGLDCTESAVDKTEVAIGIKPKMPEVFYKWTEWAEKNNIEKPWYEALKKSAPMWDTFYVIEHPVKIEDDAEIYFRPDIRRELKRQGMID